MLDDFLCQKSSKTLKQAKEIGTTVEIILDGYTCVLQPYYVGITR